MDRSIIDAISHALEYSAPTIAKTVLRKCGAVNVSKAAIKIESTVLKKPNIERKAASMIQEVGENSISISKWFVKFVLYYFSIMHKNSSHIWEFIIFVFCS